MHPWKRITADKQKSSAAGGPGQECRNTENKSVQRYKSTEMRVCRNTESQRVRMRRDAKSTEMRMHRNTKSQSVRMYRNKIRSERVDRKVGKVWHI